MSEFERELWRAHNGLRPGAVGFRLEPGQMLTTSTRGPRPAQVVAVLDPSGVAFPGLAVSVTFADGARSDGVVVAVVDSSGTRRDLELGRAGRCLFERLEPGPLACAVGGRFALSSSADPIIGSVLAAPAATVPNSDTDGSFELRFAALLGQLHDVQAAFERALADQTAGRVDAAVGQAAIDQELVLVVAKGSSAPSSEVGIVVPSELIRVLGNGTRLTIQPEQRAYTVVVYPPEPVPSARAIIALSSTDGTASVEASVERRGRRLVAKIRWDFETQPSHVHLGLWIA
jgi:hypothetical protein